MGKDEEVRKFLEEKGLEFVFKKFDSGTESSYLASVALGCSVAEIAKSIVFEAEAPVVVILSGDRKVDKKKLEKFVGKAVNLARPEYVLEKTGYEIGGVPPFPHREEVNVIPDISLTRFSYVWASGGTKDTVFRISVIDMLRTIGKEAYDLSL